MQSCRSFRQPGTLLPGLGLPQRVAVATVKRVKPVMVALWGGTGNRGATPGRKRLLTSPSLNWLVVKLHMRAKTAGVQEMKQEVSCL